MDFPTKTQRARDRWITAIMTHIYSAYQPESPIYQSVKKALEKFSLKELENLDVMLITQTSKEPRP